MQSSPNEDGAWGRPVTRRCPECGSRFERKLVRFEFEGEDFGYFPADVCANGHEYFPPESRGQIQKLAKALGLWGSKGSTTATSIYGETHEIELPGGVLMVEELSGPTRTGSQSISISRQQVKKRIASPSTGFYL